MHVTMNSVVVVEETNWTNCSFFLARLKITGVCASSSASACVMLHMAIDVIYLYTSWFSVINFWAHLLHKCETVSLEKNWLVRLSIVWSRSWTVFVLFFLLDIVQFVLICKKSEFFLDPRVCWRLSLQFFVSFAYQSLFGASKWRSKTKHMRLVVTVN